MLFSWMVYVALVSTLAAGAAWALERALASRGLPTRWAWLTGIVGLVTLSVIGAMPHTVDSSDMAFRTAAQIGMREGMVECKPVLLEPVRKVEIAVPSEATPKVNGIVSQRRGQLLGFDARPGWDGWDVVEAMIPESEIGDLIVELRSATAGVGTFSSHFDHLAELTGRLADQAVEKAKAKAA